MDDLLTGAVLDDDRQPGEVVEDVGEGPFGMAGAGRVGQELVDGQGLPQPRHSLPVVQGRPSFPEAALDGFDRHAGLGRQSQQHRPVVGRQPTPGPDHEVDGPRPALGDRQFQLVAAVEVPTPPGGRRRPRRVDERVCPAPGQPGNGGQGQPGDLVGRGATGHGHRQPLECGQRRQGIVA